MDTKSFKEIMEDLGFNEDASFETKKAFLKHLFATANKQEQQLQKLKLENEYGQSNEQVQLSLFDQTSKNKTA